MLFERIYICKWFSKVILQCWVVMVRASVVRSQWSEWSVVTTLHSKTSAHTEQQIVHCQAFFHEGEPPQPLVEVNLFHQHKTVSNSLALGHGICTEGCLDREISFNKLISIRGVHVEKYFRLAQERRGHLKEGMTSRLFQLYFEPVAQFPMPQPEGKERRCQLTGPYHHTTWACHYFYSLWSLWSTCSSYDPLDEVCRSRALLAWSGQKSSHTSWHFKKLFSPRREKSSGGVTCFSWICRPRKNFPHDFCPPQGTIDVSSMATFMAHIAIPSINYWWTRKKKKYVQICVQLTLKINLAPFLNQAKVHENPLQNCQLCKDCLGIL